jgi:adenylate kinase family enzyme
MTNILIFGNSGSGKSTLAKQLVESLQLGKSLQPKNSIQPGKEPLAHLDLDNLAWLPTNPPKRAPLAQSNRQIQAFTQANKNWVIEGCYADLLELVAEQASEIIFMNLGVQMCVENAKNRPWEPHKYESKAAQDKNLEMLIDWIKQYDQRDDEFSQIAHQRFYDGFAGKKTMHCSNVR